MWEDSGKRQVVFMTGSKTVEKKKSLVDVISEIQQYSVMEKHGTEVPAQYLALKGRLEYFGAGMRSGLIIGLALSVGTPFIIHDSVKNIVLLFVLPLLSVGLMYGMYITRYCSGEFTKAMIKNLLGGFCFGSALNLILACCVYYGIVIFVESSRNLYSYSVMRWLVSVKPLLKQCPKWILCGTLLTSVLPFYKSIFLKIRR
jgi:hypothetical protein